MVYHRGVMNTSTDFLPDPAAIARINRIKLLREIEELGKTESRKSTWQAYMHATWITASSVLAVLLMLWGSLWNNSSSASSLMVTGAFVILTVIGVASTWAVAIQSMLDSRWIKAAELMQILAREVDELKSEK
jgi:hypothetical protein